MNNLIYGLSRAMAWLGAVVLTLIALMSVVSIVGRSLSGFGLGPVPGDFELVEAGTALAVFCFLPWCHLKGGHALVDMFWNSYPPGLQRALIVLSDALMFAVWRSSPARDIRCVITLAILRLYVPRPPSVHGGL